MRPSLRSLWLPLLTLLFFINSKDAAAQIYPVQVTVQAIPPYPIYLRDFAAPTAASDRIRLQLLLTDLNVPSRQVRLKMKLNNTSGGAVIQNGDVVSRALPIQLSGGIPLYLGSADLDPYFSPDNLPGLSPTAYTEALPEGVYQLCFEIFDYISGERLSRPTCFTLSIIQNDPPLLSLPRNHEAVAIANPQSLLFQWTPRAIGASAVEYEFTLVEQLDSLLPPQVAVLSPPLYQVTTYATSLYLGPLDAPLQPGHRYCWRVQAKARAGTETIGTFKNNGYSEVWAFRVTDANCTAPTGLIAIEQGKRSLKLGWTALADLTPSYRLSYRVHESSSVNGGTWYDRPASTNSLQIFDLDPATEYEVRVGRPCTGGDYLYGNSIYVSTRSATDSTANASCGLPPNPVDVSNTSPLTTLSPAEKFTAGDFEVTAVEVTGGSGTYSGKGYITVPYLANAKVKVKWDGIRLNSDRKLVQGVVETTWDPTMHGITNIDAVFNGGSGTGSVVTGTVATDYHTSFEIGGAGDFSFSGTDDNPVITIADHNNGGGSGLTIPAGPPPVSVSDPSGDVYVVETGSNGHPVVVRAATPVPLAMTAAQLNTLSPDKGKVVFARGAATQYGFDAYRSEYEASTAWSNKYEALGTAPVYRVPAKATLAGKPDRIVAQVSLNDAALVADSVQFITGKGLRYTSRPLPGGDYEVLLVGSAANDAQEVYALYPKRALQGGTAADSGKYLSLGKVLVAGYAPVTAKVVLVPVNGATIDSAAVRTELAKAYNPIGIKWEVQQSAPWADSSWDADHNGKLKVTGTSGWSVYTAEMDALNAAYKASHTLVNGAAYLFVLPGVADNGGAAVGGDVAGDMPRGKRFGYLFAGALNGNTGRVAAHELGHGMLKLMHTFDNAYGFGEGALGQNLMSYGVGDSLGKVQWDAAHAPGLVVGVWEGDGDAQMAVVSNIEALDKYKNGDGSLTFLSVAGKPITLKGNLTKVAFITSEDRWKIDSSSIPLGTLAAFVLDGNYYVAWHQVGGGNFYGYRDSVHNKYYTERLSNSKQYTNVLAGIPCIRSGSPVFKVFPTNYLDQNPIIKNVADSNRGEGIEQDIFFLSNYLQNELHSTELYAQMTPLTDAQLFFLNKYAPEGDLCGADAMYAFKAAYLIDKKPGLLICLSDAESDANAALNREYLANYQMAMATTSQADALKVVNPQLEQGSLKAGYEQNQLQDKDFLKHFYNSLSLFQRIIDGKQGDLSTLSAQSVGEVLKVLDVRNAKGRTCLLRSLPISLREALLKKHNEWTITTSKESLMADLVETTPDADVNDLIFFLEGNNYQWFWSLYNDLNGGASERFVSSVSWFVLKQNTGANPLPAWPDALYNAQPLPESGVTHYLYIGKNVTKYLNDVSYTYNSDAQEIGGGDIKLSATSSRSTPDNWGHSNYERYFTGHPFQLVRIRFRDDFRFAKLGTNERIKETDDIVVPAIWVYYILKKQSSAESWANIRIIVDAGAVIVSVGTMEPGPLLAAEVLMNGTDIAFTLAEDRITSSGTAQQQQILDAWNIIYGAYGTGLITKSIVANASKFTISRAGIASKLQALRATPQKISQFATDLANLLAKVKDINPAAFNGRNLFYSAMLSGYLEVKIANYVRTTENISLLVQQGNKVVVQYLATGVQVADVVQQADNSILLSNLRWYNEGRHGVVTKVLGKLEGVGYTNKAGLQVAGDVELVAVQNGQAFVREVAAIGDLAKNLTGFLKSSYEDLVAVSLRVVEEESKIKFLDNTGRQLFEISDGKLIIKYGGFGNDIIMTEGKVTTVLGKFAEVWNDANSNGTRYFLGSASPYVKGFPTGSIHRGLGQALPGRLNFLDLPEVQYNALINSHIKIQLESVLGSPSNISLASLSVDEVQVMIRSNFPNLSELQLEVILANGIANGNEAFWVTHNLTFLELAFQRGDDVRLVSDPSIYQANAALGGTYKKELDAILGNDGFADKYGYTYNSSTKTFTKH